MSLDASPYRYEVMGENRRSQRALLQQEERIMGDGIMDAKVNAVHSNADINKMSAWRESLEEESQRRTITLNGRQAINEQILGKKGQIMVRRAALRKLLDNDLQQYEIELHSLGKSFYVKRT